MKPEENELNPYQKSLLPFDPVVLVLDACRKWVLVLVVALIVGMGAYVYTDSGYVPWYTSSCTLVLTTRDSTSSVYDNLNSTSTLAGVFSEVLNSSVMRSNILNELQMDSFDGSIWATAIEETNLLTISVRGRDPRSTFRVMQVLLEKHGMVTYEVMGDIVLEVLEHPVVPMQPSNWTNAGRAFKLATVVAGAAVFVLLMVIAYFRDVIRSKEEADEKLGCWCLGEIRHERKKRTLKEIIGRKKRSILITDPQTSFRFLTTMDKLSRSVVQRIPKDKGKKMGKVILVTSVMENEGKSTVSANLALALAKKYPKVLLLDCDLRKPACSKILEYEKPGHYTHEVIRGDAELADAVCSLKLTRMQALFAKHCTPQEAGQLISSDGMGQLLDKARESYDFIIVDMAPMSVVSDSEAVMEFADASLLVIRQNGVLVTDLNRAISDLQRGEAKLLGCVINNVYSTELLSGEGYGTGYSRYGGYGNYGRYGRYGRYGVYAQRQTEE